MTPDETARLPRLLARVDTLRASFPVHTGASGQAAWIREQYTDGQPPSLNLITLLLFEHGVHRSTEQVAQDLAMLREES